jgi:hypothetical protein
MSTTRMDGFYDIYGLWHIPWWQQPIFKIVVVAIVLVLVLGFIAYLLKKLTNRKRTLSAGEVAQRDLASLGTPDMLNERKAKFFYSQLTTIIKQYICVRYGFDIVGKTDREMLMFLDEQVVFPRDLMPLLYDIFDHASQIKFANSAGIVEQMQSDLALGVRLIKETIPLQSV